MNRNTVLHLILEREEAFTRWHTLAMGYASVPPSHITDWSQLPPFPPGCTPGVPISKTTVRIPQAWRGRKHEYVMRLASFVLSYTYNLYEHTALTAFATTPSPCLGIVKQCGNEVAIHWFEFTIDGGLVQVATRHSIYAARTQLFQSTMPARALDMIQDRPDQGTMLRGIAARHSKTINKSVRQYWPPFRLLRGFWGFTSASGRWTSPLTLVVVGMVAAWGTGIVAPLILVLFNSLFQIDISQERMPVLLASTWLGLVVTGCLIPTLGRVIAEHKRCIAQFRRDVLWSLSFLYFPALTTTAEEWQEALGKSHDQQSFTERMGGVLKELQAYAENQE
jgi:hypothetical protein